MLGRRYLYSKVSVSQIWMESSLKQVRMAPEKGRKKTFWGEGGGREEEQAVIQLSIKEVNLAQGGEMGWDMVWCGGVVVGGAHILDANFLASVECLEAGEAIEVPEDRVL